MAIARDKGDQEMKSNSVKARGKTNRVWSTHDIVCLNHIVPTFCCRSLKWPLIKNNLKLVWLNGSPVV